MTKGILIIEVNLLPPRELSANYRCHWGTQHKARTAARDAVMWAVLSNRPLYEDWQAPDKARVSMVLIIKSGRNKIDPDNSWARAKPFLDGLKQAGIIINDSAKHLELGTVTFEIDPDKAPATRLIVEVLR